jgi:DNA-binding Lrp family transcriptional regulator
LGYDLEISEIDLRIIRLLQNDARSFSKIAKTLALSVGTIYNHVKKLEEKGILIGYTVAIDSNKLGYDLIAVTLIQIDEHNRAKVTKELGQFENIIVFYDITGDYDMLVIGRFKGRNMLNNFIKNIKKLPDVKKTLVHVALDVIKEDFRLKL